MVFIRIYNVVFSYALCIFKKSGHLICDDIFNNGERIYFYGIGEPVFFGENHIRIKGIIL